MSEPTLTYIPSSYKAGKTYSVIPANGDGDFVFSRASEGSRLDANGDIETMAIDVPRIQYPSCPSLLLEPSRTNLFLNSFVPVTQTVTVVNATSYAISCSGSGSIELTGAITGTVTEGNQVIDTSATTSLTLTITGVLDWVQVETGTFPTMPIETLGTTITRTIEAFSLNDLNTNSIFGSNQGTIFLNIKGHNPTLSEGNISGVNNLLNLKTGGSQEIRLHKYAAGSLRWRDYSNGAGGIGIGSPFGDGASKTALSWLDDKAYFALNGVLDSEYTALANFPTIDNFASNVNMGSISLSDVTMFNTRLTDQELIDLTT